MHKYKCILFDFDGTVVNTGMGILRSLQYSFEKMGQRIPDMEELKRFIGPPVYYSFTHFYGVSDDEVGDYIKRYRERYKEKGIYESELYAGMKELLIDLKKKGILLGVASSKPEHLIYSVADFLGITDLFDVIVGVKTDDSTLSSKTGLILEAMENLAISDRNEVLMVGDRCFDIDGATGAQVDSCGALWGFGNKEEFIEHNATYIAENPADIINMLL